MKPILLLSFLLIAITINAQWAQQGLDIDGQFNNEKIGNAVDMPDPFTLAVGAKSSSLVNGFQAGKVSVHRWNGNSWSLKGTPLFGSAPANNFGTSVSMPDSNTLAVSAPSYMNKGQVKIFNWNGSSWVQKGIDLLGDSVSGPFGALVCMPDSNTIAVGISDRNSFGSSKTGQVKVFRWDGNSWLQRGNLISGDSTGDQLGWSVSMPDSNTLAVSAPFADGANKNDCGEVKIFSWSGISWVQKGASIFGEASSDFSGESISMPDSNTLAIGAAVNDGNGPASGHARVFRWNGTNWLQKGLDIDGEASGDYSGKALSMPDSNTIAIGAFFNQGNGIDAGHVRVFSWNNSSWTQKGMDLDAESAGDRFGESVHMPEANIVCAGATENDGSFTNAGHVRVFRDTSFSTGLAVFQEAETALIIYPNPTKNNFIFKVDRLLLNQRMQILSMQGQVIFESRKKTTEQVISVNDWDAGIYFVRYGDSIKKLVITK